MDNLIPLGTSLLSSYLKKEGHDFKLFDTTFYKTREETGDDARVKSLQVAKTNLADYGILFKKNSAEEDLRTMIKEYQPDIIGFSSVESTFYIGVNLLNAIADIKIPKIMGGIHPTLAPEQVISQPNLEMICVGEGEGAMVDLANKIDKGEDYSTTQNLWIKKDGKVIKNGLRPLINVNELPFQDWTIYEPQRFFKPMGGKVYVMGNIELNRSCMHSCTFCANDALHKVYASQGKYYRERDVDKVVEELTYLKDKHSLEYVYFIAENFLAMSKNRFQKFGELYKNIQIPFFVDTRADTVNAEKIKSLEKMGCEGIAMGIESGDPLFRRTMLKRRMKNEKIINAVDIIRNNSDIRVSVNNIIGFPTETREQIFKTIELNRQVNAHYVMVNIFTPYHGTELRDVAIREGYISEDQTAGDFRIDAGLDMPQLSQKSIQGLQRTFPLYVKFPKSRWPEIKEAEKFSIEGDKKFSELSEEYTQKYFK